MATSAATCEYEVGDIVLVPQLRDPRALIPGGDPPETSGQPGASRRAST